MMKRAAIFCNGDLSDVSTVKKYINAQTLLIGCDGGTAHILSLGLMPRVVIGDFDSLSSKTFRLLRQNRVECIKYPRDKLCTDTELGLMLAKKRGYTDIIMTGIRGRETDHLIANLALLGKKRYLSLNLRMIDGKEEMTLVRREIDITGKKGDIISLIPIGDDARGVSTEGLFYPLKNAKLRAWTSQGLRNHLTGKQGKVALKKGSLLVIHQSV